MLCIEVSCVKIGTDSLFVNRCLGKPILKKRWCNYTHGIHSEIFEEAEVLNNLPELEAGVFYFLKAFLLGGSTSLGSQFNERCTTALLTW